MKQNRPSQFDVTLATTGATDADGFDAVDIPTEFDAAAETVTTPDFGDGECKKIEATLKDFGVCPLPELVIALDNLIDQRAIPRAREVTAAAFKELARKLSGNPAAVALRVLIRGMDGLTQEQLAAEAGCSRQNLIRKKEKIAQRLKRGVQTPRR